VVKQYETDATQHLEIAENLAFDELPCFAMVGVFATEHVTSLKMALETAPLLQISHLCAQGKSAHAPCRDSIQICRQGV
jgi:hypothetical protein